MLLLGGPLHGGEREVAEGENEIIVMAPSPGNPIPTPWKYVKRGIEAETRPGMVFTRTVLVEQGMQVEVAAQALAAVLMQRFAEELVRQFMEGGQLIGYAETSDNESLPGRNDESVSSGGIILAKR